MELICAELSEKAYDDGIDDLLESRFVDCGGTQVHVLREGRKIFIAFRGTSEGIDVWTDLKFWRNKKDVHSGIYDAFKHVEVQINEVLKEWKAERREIYYTGHSLGGALAMLAAANCPWRTCIRGIYTFGAPRIGGKEFVRRYLLEDVTHNFVNSADPVPRMQLLKEDIENKILLHGKKRFVNPSAWRMWRVFALAFRRRKDHSIKNYIKKLRSIK